MLLEFRHTYPVFHAYLSAKVVWAAALLLKILRNCGKYLYVTLKFKLNSYIFDIYELVFSIYCLQIKLLCLRTLKLNHRCIV